MKRTEQEEKAVASLQAIVNSFNVAFDAWGQEFGAVAEFSWAFQRIEGTPDAAKHLAIAGIDRIIYRRPAPSAEQFRHRLDELSGEEEENDD